MKISQFPALPTRPDDIPANAPRFWPIVEVASFVGLISKPVILAVIAIIWWAALTFRLSVEIGAIIGTVICLAILIAFIPALVGVYWQTQLLDIEERRQQEKRRKRPSAG